jgi:FAD:protein FMN transferase
MTTTLTRRFGTMGGQGSIHLESATAGPRRLDDLACAVQALFADVEATLSPYLARSELSALNRDGRPAVPASPLLADLARTARRASAQTRGLVDATLPVQTRPREPEPPALREALGAAPPRRAARPLPDWRERQPSVDRDGRVCRPAGMTLDPGGLAKGMAADLAAALVPEAVAYAISCGGDLAVRGREWEVGVTGAHTGEEVHRLRVRSGGIATSGIYARLWREDDGTPAHHILEPVTGRPAWTGLVAVTAVAAGALDAEILAKGALLSGPQAARRLLRVRGGVLQHDDGTVEVLDGLPAARLAPIAA